MAEVLKKFPDEAVNVGFRAKYPWDEWSDGKIRKLTRGIDFNCTVSNFRTYAYSQFGRRGKRAKIHSNGDETIIVQAIEIVLPK